MMNNKHKNKIKPKVEVYIDEYDEACSRLVKQLKPINKYASHNVPIFKKAIEAIKKSKNPEKELIINVLYAFLNESLAEIKKSPEEKLPFLQKALGSFKKNRGKNKKDIARLEGKVLKVEIEIVGKRKPRDISLLSRKFLEASEKFKLAKQERDSLFTLGMHFMYRASLLFGRPESLSLLKKAEKIFKKTGFKDGVHKMRSMYFRFLSHYQSTPQQAIDFLLKSIEEIDKTSDKYGKKEAIGSLHYLKAHMASSAQQKADEFEKAGELYIEDGYKEKGYNLIGRAYSLRARDSNISITEVLNFQRKAFENFKKAKNNRAYHNVRGYYFGTRAIQKGILGDSGKLFRKYCIKAIEEFRKAQNRSEEGFFGGVLSLLYSIDLPTNKKVEALKIAGCLLNKKRVGLGDFAYCQFFKTKAEIEPNSIKRREYKEKAIEYLRKITSDLENRIKKDKYGVDFTILKKKDTGLLLLLRTDLFQLEAQLATNSKEKKEKYEKAIENLDLLYRESPDNSLIVFRGKGWLYNEQGDFDKSVEMFTKAAEIAPRNISAKKELEYAQELLKTGFRKLREEKKLKDDYMAQAFGGALLEGDNIFYGEFVPKLLEVINKRGCIFEDNPSTYNIKTEPQLRDEILGDLNSVFVGDATSESKIGDGKTDIKVKNPFKPYDKAIIECKWWNGSKSYLDAKRQLFSYLPPRQEYGILVIFVKEKNFNNVIKKAKEVMQRTEDYIPNSLRSFDIFGREKFFFISRHKSEKGSRVDIYHLFFNLYSRQ